MKIKLKGGPEELIKRCPACSYCIFEEILSPKQRQIKILETEIPQNHINRRIIEQICGNDYTAVCPMKYAAMRASCDDRTVAQMGVVKIYIWDLGKKHKQKFDFNQALFNWGKSQDLGRGKEESYAKRFEEVWNKGIRNIYVNNVFIKQQFLTVDFIYEIVISEPKTYENALDMLDLLIKEHKMRDSR